MIGRHCGVSEVFARHQLFVSSVAISVGKSKEGGNLGFWPPQLSLGEALRLHSASLQTMDPHMLHRLWTNILLTVLCFGNMFLWVVGGRCFQN